MEVPRSLRVLKLLVGSEKLHQKFAICSSKNFRSLPGQANHHLAKKINKTAQKTWEVVIRVNFKGLDKPQNTTESEFDRIT